jgi:hypothetical protein
MAVLTTTGKQWIVDKMRATGGAAAGTAQASPNDQMKYIGWGTGTTAEAASQTALVTAAAEARVAGTITSPSAALHRVVGTLTSASSQTIAEVGLFDQLAAGGTMLIRAVFTGIALQSGDQIQFTIDFTQT